MPEVCRILLVEDNPGDARLVMEMLADAGDRLFQVQCADTLLAALDALAAATFEAALVDLSLPDCHGLDTFLTIQLHAPAMPVIVLTGLDSDEMAMAAVDKGAQDYLAKGKITTDSLVRALQYGIVRQHKASSQVNGGSGKGRLIGVLGPKGGVGVTTLACSFGVALRRQTAEPVLLADVDASGAGCAFALRLTPRYTIADAATSLHRLDSEFWKGVVCKAGEIDVLASPGSVGYHEPLAPERVRHVLRFVRSLYRNVVVDLGRFQTSALHLLEDAQEMYVVTTGDLPALFETRRLLKRLSELGLERDHVRLLLNRLQKPGMAGDIEQALGHPIFASIGDHTTELNEAWSAGRVEMNGRLQKQVAGFVRHALGVEEPSVSRSVLGMLKLARA